MSGIDKSKVEYVIGIDLGHGETSAALCSLQWDTPVDQLDPVKDLELGGNKKVIPSAITILDNGIAYIGDSAFSPNVLKNAEVKVCFKKKPQNIDGESEKIMIRFMSEVYKRIRENNSALLIDGNHIVFIATPSGWNDADQKLYFEMAQKAGIPIAGVTRESRAAFVRAQHDTTSGLGRNIEKGAIVFDMGSSTLDFTFMKKGMTKPIDYGYDCGASHVEKFIFSERERDNEAIHLFEQKYPKLVDYLMFEARKVKEQVYNETTLPVKKTINFDDFIDDEELEDERFKLAFKPGELDVLLENEGYIQNIRNAMFDYKDHYIPNEKIYGVFMTGGASRMDFMKKIICECWNVDESQVYKDNDPSLTISQGVAEVARMDLRTEGMDTGLEDAINQITKSSIVFETFVELFGHDLWDKVTDEMANVINNWANSESAQCLNDLQKGINNSVSTCVSKMSKQVPRYIDTSIQECTKNIRETVEGIVAHYSSQGIEVTLPTIQKSEIKVSGLNMNSVLNDIANQLKQESSGWGAAIGGAAVGGVAALIFGGPLAWIIGGGALLGKWLFGEEKSEAQKKKEAMEKWLNAEERQGVLNSLSENWEKTTNDVANSIRSALNDNKELRKSIDAVANGYLQAYKESLKTARILIN